MNRQDVEEETEEAGAEITEITMLQAQQAIDCLKRYIIQSGVPEDVSEEFRAAAAKVNKHLSMTRMQKRKQKKIRLFYVNK